MPPFHKILPDLNKKKSVFPHLPWLTPFSSPCQFPLYHLSQLVMILIYISVLFNCQSLELGTYTLLILCVCVCVCVCVYVYTGSLIGMKTS